MASKFVPKPFIAISSKRPYDQSWYEQQNQNGDRHFTTAWEEQMICTLAAAYPLGYYGLAWWIYGNGDPKYKPTGADVSRIGKVLSANGQSIRSHRRGETIAARQRIAMLMRESAPKNKLKLRTA